MIKRSRNRVIHEVTLRFKVERTEVLLPGLMV